MGRVAELESLGGVAALLRMRILNLAGLSLAALLVGGCCLVPHPLRRSEAHLRASLLKSTPPGSSFADVWTFADKKSWPIRGATNYGVRPADVGGPRHATETVGVKSIRGNLGHYWGCPWRIDVAAFWAFDADDRLIDVWIWKTADAL